MSIDDYKGMTCRTLERVQIKKLLGAISCMYDSQLQQSGINPQDLRNLESQFTTNCKPVENQLYQNLKNVSFNYFHSVDTFEMPDGWTDYGDEDWTHTGLRIESPFRIIAVKFRQYIAPFRDYSERFTDISVVEEQVISSMDVFRLMGVEVFRKIADLEDWETIIRSF